MVVKRAYPEWLQRLTWPLAALGLLLLFNLFFTPNFFKLEWREGHLYGTLMDILKHGSRVMILSLGMTLVIATGGVDLSVGAVMAISGALMAVLVHDHHQSWTVGVAVALAVSLAAGVWNAVLVAGFRVQPIVATLVLMVAGRGIAQLITDGQIITFTSRELTYIANGHLLGIPVPVWIALFMLALTAALTRWTALGLFIEATGNNEVASTYAGIRVRLVKGLTYVCCGLCAGMAGLIAASNIRAADSNNAGLYFELDAILAVVVGGTALTGGRFFLAGSIIGAILIQTLTTTMYARDVSPDIAPVPKALVIIAVCLLQSEAFRRKAARVFRRSPA